MSLVSEKLRKLAPYDPDVDTGVIHLDANESFIGLPEELREEIASAVKNAAFNRYPDPLAVKTCEAFASRYGVESRFVTAGNGSDELIGLLLNTFTQRGDRVLITEPDFSMYRIYCDLAELEPVILGKRGDLTFQPDEMIRTANEDHVRLILFSNPCNPTGQGITAEEVLRIVREVSCLVVVDEAYMDFWDQSVLSKITEFQNLIILKTCSKIGLAAARLGFAVTNDTLTRFLRAAKSPYNVNTMTQAAGEVFLKSREFLGYVVETVRQSRDRLTAELSKFQDSYPQQLRVFEPHANFVTVEVKDAPVIHQKLKAAGVSVRLMAGRYFRVTAGTEEENRTFLQEFSRILSQPD